MIFQENRLLADDSHELSYLIFFSKIRKKSHKICRLIVAFWVNEQELAQRNRIIRNHRTDILFPNKYKHRN